MIDSILPSGTGLETKHVRACKSMMFLAISAVSLLGAQPQGCDFCADEYDVFIKVLPNAEIYTTSTCGFFFDEVRLCVW